ncbi:outer membrane lipoprotein LolB [Marinomonas agarivorans]|nr:outer membrane lipoprotein LolB [Marinomonas agarivorans]
MIRNSIILVALFLVACSTPPKQEKKTFESVDDIKQWSNSGRVGIRTSSDAISGNFRWFHSDDKFEFIISGPFGQGTTKLHGVHAHEHHQDIEGHEHHQHNSVTLEYKDVVVTGSDAEALLADHLGWQFPIFQISYWVKGIKYPHSDAIEVFGNSEQGNLQLNTLIQDEWRIEYKRYQEVNGLNLPQKLQAEKPPYRVNLIINDWELE